MTLRHAACAFAALVAAPACSVLVSLDGLSSGAEPATPAEAGTTAEAGSEAGTDGGGSSVDCPAPETGLLAYYRFDETAGAIAKDCSGNGHDGTIISPAWSSGKHGGALVLNGSDTCMTIAGTQQLIAAAAFTVTAFANVAVFAIGSNAGYILAKANKVPDTRSWRFSSDTTTNFSFKIGAASGAAEIATPNGQPSNAWVHVAAVFDPGKRMEIWVDGVRSADRATAPANLVDEPTAPLRVGCLVTSNFFNGKLDELRLYGRALASTEIQRLAR